MAEQRDLADVGTSHLAWATSLELAYGNTEQAVQLARRVLSRNPSYDPRLRAALVLGITGSGLEAEGIANEVASANPEHTLINSVLVPIVRAAVELGRQLPARAIEHLENVAQYELGFIAALIPVYLRARSYLMLRSAARAAGEFQRLLDHRGTDPFSPFHAAASVGLARALALAGDAEGSRGVYEQFLGRWGRADADVPILREAREECARLSRASSPT